MKNQIGTKASTKPVKPVSPSSKNPNEANIFELGAKNPPLQLAPTVFIKVDHATLFDNIAIVSGWVSEDAHIEFDDVLGTIYVERPDAASAVNLPARGFVSIIAAHSVRTTLNCNVTINSNRVMLPVNLSTTAEEVKASMQYFAGHSKRLMAHYAKSHFLRKYLAQHCQAIPNSMRADIRSGHLDTVKTFPGFGYVAYGWAIDRERCDLWLVTDNGHWHSLAQSVRFSRPDVADAFADSFGIHAAEAGFICFVKIPGIEHETPIRLIAAADEGLFVVHEMTVSNGPQTPSAYAKWAFSLSTPPSKFFDRLNACEGELIEYLITQNRAGYPDDIEAWKTDDQPLNPQISVIVPLFGRADFVEYQLSRFARDPDFKDGTVELIYVIDDPTLLEPLLRTYHQLFRLYRVPFQLIWGKVNRGYSGANNLGLKVARSDTILLLNSDVFPVQEGWARRMNSELLCDENIGAVGTRLDFADGSVQHQGMTFEYSPELNVWLNEHPMRGLDVPLKSESYCTEAATGACLAVRRKDLIALGGLDEGYLIGDFEDSDLCLKLRNLRGRIVIAGGTRLVHLERQSFINLGNGDFRTSVVKFNAWRHNRLWNTTIAALKEKF